MIPYVAVHWQSSVRASRWVVHDAGFDMINNVNQLPFEAVHVSDVADRGRLKA